MRTILAVAIAFLALSLIVGAVAWTFRSGHNEAGSSEGKIVHVRP